MSQHDAAKRALLISAITQHVEAVLKEEKSRNWKEDRDKAVMEAESARAELNRIISEIFGEAE